MPKYVFDSSVFVQAKNLYYQFGFCGGFWDWVRAGHEKDLFFSCKKVHAELCAANDDDEAKKWALGIPETFFLDDVKDGQVMVQYANIMNWAQASTHYLPAAKTEFAQANEADPFLLAVAKAHGYTIVTQEKSNPAKKNRIPLPDAATAFDVPSIFVYDLLSKHATSTFQLHP